MQLDELIATLTTLRKALPGNTQLKGTIQAGDKQICLEQAPNGVEPKKYNGQSWTGTQEENSLEKLAWKLTLCQAMLKSTPTGVLLVDPHGQKILQNEMLGTLFHIPKAILDQQDDEKMLNYVMELISNPTEFKKKVDYYYAHPKEKGHEEILLKDGTILDRYTAPVIAENGTNFGRVWYFRDTKQKTAEKKLTETHCQLMDASRQAGMAEVATSVLHNVGNVLNSINI